MTQKKLIKLGGTLNILTGVLLVLWWLLMGLLLPQAAAKDNFDIIVTHSNWIPINLIGFVAVQMWSLSFFFIFLVKSDKIKIRGIVGFILGEIGIVWYACIQYYETFIWPVVGRQYPEMVKIEGALVFGDTTVLIPLMLSGVFLGLGYILICIDLFKEKIFSKGVIWMLLIGALLFGNGIVIGIRTIGLILFVIAFIKIGFVLIKEAKE